MSARKDFSTFASLWLLSNRADIFAFCDQTMPQTMPQTVLQTVLRLCSQLMLEFMAAVLFLPLISVILSAAAATSFECVTIITHFPFS